MNNYAAYYPPGADADLIKRDREQAAAEERIRKIRRQFMDMPARELVSAYPGDQILRLERMVQILADAESKRLLWPAAIQKLRHEYDAILTEAVEWQAEREGLL